MSMGLGLSGAGVSGSLPTAKTAIVSGSSAGALYTISRLLGATSTVSLIAGTNANLTLSGTSVQAAIAIGAGNSQTVAIRELMGAIAIEYPLVLTGDIMSLGPTTASFFTNAAIGSQIAAFTNLNPGETMVSVSPSDGHVGIGFSGTAIVVGSTAATAGTINYAFTSSLGRTATIAITAQIAATFLPTTLGQAYSAAHSTQRLYSDYTGPLFRVRNAAGTVTQDIPAFPSSAALPPDSDIQAFVTVNGAAYFDRVYQQLAGSSVAGPRTIQLPLGTTATRPVALTEKTPSGALYIDSNDEMSAAWISTGYAINLQDYSLFVAYQCTSGSSQCLVSLNDGTTNQMFITTFEGRFNINDAASLARTAGTWPQNYLRSNAQITGITATSSQYRLHLCEQVLVNPVAPTSGTATALRYGSDLGNRPAYTRWCGSVLIAGALSSADGGTLYATMGVMFGFQQSFDRRLTIIGDSIESDTTNNNFSIKHRSPWTYCSFNGSTEVVCLAVPGRKVTDSKIKMLASGDFTMLAKDGNMKYGAGKSIVYFEQGINDVFAGVAAATIEGNVSDGSTGAFDTLKIGAPGIKLVVGCLSPSSGTNNNGTQEGVREAYNLWLAGNPNGRIDSLIRWDDTASTMGATAAADNTALYGDGTHPTDLGRKYRGGSIAQPSPISIGPKSLQAAINALW